MAGDTEFRLASHDSFWTWREAMYALANRIEPGRSRTHRDPAVRRDAQGRLHLGRGISLPASPGAAQLRWRQCAVAGGRCRGRRPPASDSRCCPRSIISSDFGGRPLLPEQRRFGSKCTNFSRRRSSAAPAGARARPTLRTRRGPPQFACGAARDSCAKRWPACAPSIGRRHAYSRGRATAGSARLPVEHPADVRSSCCSIPACSTAHWCLVHATHATAAESRQWLLPWRQRLCLSEHRRQSRRWVLRCRPSLRSAAAASASARTARPPSIRPRNCAGWNTSSASSGAARRAGRRAANRMSARALARGRAHGARALGQPVGSIEVGRRADWLVLDAEHPGLRRRRRTTAARPAACSVAASSAIRDVMVGGRWVVKDGQHAAEERIAAASRLMQRLAAAAALTSGHVDCTCLYSLDSCRPLTSPIPPVVMQPLYLQVKQHILDNIDSGSGALRRACRPRTTSSGRSACRA